ncbi:hypothetical protein M8C21_021947 [Ambrosia artemisiifolia]|uniref:Uncharacterized protein n=1 Tax=Ambrosia artemisiifolia TaxID=4212 RepID=A0AAD5C4L0_AMBAR|nr:hypothetical protein M8C21_021947 [Ambrosia artemisiifolia]
MSACMPRAEGSTIRRFRSQSIVRIQLQPTSPTRSELDAKLGGSGTQLDHQQHGKSLPTSLIRRGKKEKALVGSSSQSEFSNKHVFLCTGRVDLQPCPNRFFTSGCMCLKYVMRKLLLRHGLNTFETHDPSRGNEHHYHWHAKRLCRVAKTMEP